MADDDLDLDAMLDSALDEGFADTASTEPADDEPETEEVDLDSMLDDALDATAAASSSTASQRCVYSDCAEVLSIATPSLLLHGLVHLPFCDNFRITVST